MASKSARKVKESNSKRLEADKSPNFQFCKEIVMDVAEKIITNVVTLYEEYQRAEMENSICDMFEKADESILSFYALNHVCFSKASLNQISFSDIEPAVLTPDNYNRKVLEHVTRQIPPKSAIELWDKSINKVKSASVLSRLPRKSVKKTLKPQNYLQIDFSKTNLKRVNSIDQQLRSEKAASKMKAKHQKYIIKVSLIGRSRRQD